MIPCGRKIKQHHRRPEDAAADHVGRATAVHSADDEYRCGCHSAHEANAMAKNVRELFPRSRKGSLHQFIHQGIGNGL
jgi:hypothetical protein